MEALVAPTVPPGAPPGLYRDAAFRRGFSRLAAHGLTFEAWLYHPQLPDLIDLLAAHPEQKVVLNHLGGPLGVGPYDGRRGEVFDVDGHTAFLFTPGEGEALPAGAAKPWILYGPTLPGLPDEAERWMHERFTKAGVAVAGIDTGESYGSPAAVRATHAASSSSSRARNSRAGSPPAFSVHRPLGLRP